MDIARILRVQSEKLKKCESNFNLPVTNPAYSPSLSLNFNSFLGLAHHVDTTPGTFMENYDNKVTNFVNLNLFSFSLFPRVCASEDSDEVEKRKEKEMIRIKELLSKEDKWDRLKRMYSYDDFGRISPELKYMLKGAYFSTIIGGVTGAFNGLKEGKENYLRSNMATSYESEYLARRNLNDKITTAGIRGFFKNAFKFGSFSSVYMLTTITAANYNNKVTVWEHMASAAIIGGVSRINFGIKGVAVASVLGGFLGLCCGGLIKMSLWMSGISIEELRYWQHEYYMGEFSATIPKQTE